MNRLEAKAKKQEMIKSGKYVTPRMVRQLVNNYQFECEENGIENTLKGFKSKYGDLKVVYISKIKKK